MRFRRLLPSIREVGRHLSPAHFTSFPPTLRPPSLLLFQLLLLLLSLLLHVLIFSSASSFVFSFTSRCRRRHADMLFAYPATRPAVYARSLPNSIGRGNDLVVPDGWTFSRETAYVVAHRAVCAVRTAGYTTRGRLVHVLLLLLLLLVVVLLVLIGACDDAAKHRAMPFKRRSVGQSDSLVGRWRSRTV